MVEQLHLREKRSFWGERKVNYFGSFGNGLCKHALANVIEKENLSRTWGNLLKQKKSYRIKRGKHQDGSRDLGGKS